MCRRTALSSGPAPPYSDGVVQINTPDQRLRVFVSSTLAELADERAAVREAVASLRMTPILFEQGARPHPPRDLYRAYLAQCQVFVGIYWQRYGWVAPGETVSGLEDEFRLAHDKPRLLYLKRPAPDREARLRELVAQFAADGTTSYKHFSTPGELHDLVRDDLAVLLTERFDSAVDGSPSTTAAEDLLPAAPAPPSPIFGRDTEIGEVAERFAAGARLVTLTGPGGIGKTRLAVAVLEHLAGMGTPTGFVSLADVADTDWALRQVADAVGARSESEEHVLDALAERFAGRRTVLALDNLEQLDGIGPSLAVLLTRTPQLQLLATSRRALRVRAEQEVRVRPLGLPGPAAGTDETRAAPAVLMFLDRLQALAPDRAPTGSELDTITEICRRLDALPLAIELAAARARVLPLGNLLDRLGQTDILTGGPADLPERQRTMRATIEWSYRLLEEQERRLLADLSVFAGGCSLAAAEAVAQGYPDLVGTLGSLLDKSLVTVHHDGGEARFTMLGTIHRYAAEQLAARPDAGAVRAEHLRWVRQLGATAQPFLCGPGQREWVGRIDPERANLRQAVDHALSQGDDRAVIELAWDVIVYYFVRDAVGEPHSWMVAVHDAGRELPRVPAAKLGCLLALTRIHRGDVHGTGEQLRQALQVFRAEGMAFESAVALHQLGFVRLSVEHDRDGAVHALTESSELFDSVGHDWGVALAEAMLGSVLMELGEHAAAERHLSRSLERALGIDCDSEVVQARTQFALLRVLQGRPDEALGEVAAALPQLRAGRFRTDATYALDIVAAVCGRRGPGAVATEAATIAREVRRRLGVSPWPATRSLIERTGVPDGTAEQVPAGVDVFAALDRLLREATGSS